MASQPLQQPQVMFTTPTSSVNSQQTMMLPSEHVLPTGNVLHPGNVLPPAGAAVQTPAYIVVQQPPSAPLNMNVKSTRGLAIAHLLLGTFLVLLAIIHLVLRTNRWISILGTGIWVGLWVITTGILGILSSCKPQNTCLNGVNMGFSIVSCALAFIGIVMYAIAVPYESFRRYGSQGIVPSFLLALSVAEFCVALAACIFTCKTLSCCKPRAGYIQTPTNVPTVAMGGYPQQLVAMGGFPQQPVAMGGYPHQQYLTQVSQPPAYTQAQTEGVNQAMECEQKVPLQ